MKSHLLFLSLSAITFTSCGDLKSKSSSGISIDSSGQRKNITTVDVNAIEIDTFQKNDPLSLSIIQEIDSVRENIKDTDSLARKAKKFIQLHENDSLIEVPDFDSQPEEFFASYSILTENDKIIFISESPYSSSGDWYQVQQYLFYENGNTRAFSIHYSQFDGSVKGDLLNEELTCYYGKNKNLIKRSYRIFDDEGKDIDFKKLNIIPTFHDAVGAPSLNDLIKEKSFLKR